MLTCENCGHPNLLRTGAPPEKMPADPGPGARDAAGVWLRKDALVALVPAPGVGARCLKCAHLLEMDLDDTPAAEQNCARCGLNQAEAAHYAPGEAPWEQPAVGKEAQFEQAELLWAQAPEDAQKLENFAKFVLAEDLLELGIRKLRHHLVTHPDDPIAIAQLGELAASMQSRVIVATARARADAQQFEQDVNRYRHRFLTVAVILIAILLVIFIVFFAGK